MANKKGTKQTAEDILQAKAIAIAAAESVYHYRLIARSVNRDEDTLIRWRNDDTEFAEALEQGRLRFIKKNVAIAKPEFLLERLEPELFKQRSEQELNHNGNVSFVNDVPRPKKDWPWSTVLTVKRQHTPTQAVCTY